MDSPEKDEPARKSARWGFVHSRPEVKGARVKRFRLTRIDALPPLDALPRLDSGARAPRSAR